MRRPVFHYSVNITTNMKLGNDKIYNNIVYGLVPYFRNSLIKSTDKSDYYVVGYDESLNKFSQKQQLDIVIHFWDKNLN